MKKLTTILTLLFLSFFANAQDVKMADVMKENGKIYVVIAVMLTILAGLVLYLVRLDRKISKLEKNK
jgi:CcmD family protein